MSTYLYCLLLPERADLLPAGLAGLEGAPVRSIAMRGIEAWVSTARGSVAADVARARTHNEVVEAAMATGRTPLPARFGQIFADDGACLADLERRRAPLEAALESVQGTVEMGILLTADAPPPPPTPVAADAVDRRSARAGHAYLAALRAREADEQRWRERVLEQLRAVEAAVASLVRGSSPPEIGRQRVAGATAHLVAGSDVAAYRDAAARAPVAAGFHVLVAGPRAPYSFCGSEPPAAGTILAT